MKKQELIKILEEGRIWWCGDCEAFHTPKPTDPYSPDHRTRIPLKLVEQYYPKLVKFVRGE